MNIIQENESQIQVTNQPSVTIEAETKITPYRRGQALKKFIK
jgi:hypothetical protein